MLNDLSIIRINIFVKCKTIKLSFQNITFYLHYDDVYDLHENIENEVITDFKRMFESSFPTTDSNNSLDFFQNYFLFFFYTIP